MHHASRAYVQLGPGLRSFEGPPPEYLTSGRPLEADEPWNALWAIEEDSDSRDRRGSTEELPRRMKPSDCISRLHKILASSGS